MPDKHPNEPITPSSSSTWWTWRRWSCSRKRPNTCASSSTTSSRPSTSWKPSRWMRARPPPRTACRTRPSISPPPRADDWQAYPAPEEILAQAPESEEGYIIVPEIPHTELLMNLCDLPAHRIVELVLRARGLGGRGAGSDPGAHRGGGRAAREAWTGDQLTPEDPAIKVHAFITLTAERARQQAHEVDRKLAAGEDPGPLAGVPFTVKDIFCVQRHALHGGLAHPGQLHRALHRHAGGAHGSRRRR